MQKITLAMKLPPWRYPPPKPELIQKCSVRKLAYPESSLGPPHLVTIVLTAGSPRFRNV